MPDPPKPAPPDGGKTYLSDLKEASKVNWPFKPPGTPPGAPPTRADGMPEVRVKGVTSPHGIFMHPPPPGGRPASVSYKLGKQYSTFQAQVSLNDGPPRSVTPLTFAVYGDGHVLWKSKPLSTQDQTQECKVPVQNVDVLKIEVISLGDPRAGHGVWLEPALEK
jgi:hypothetical protein